MVLNYFDKMIKRNKKGVGIKTLMPIILTMAVLLMIILSTSPQISRLLTGSKKTMDVNAGDAGEFTAEDDAYIHDEDNEGAEKTIKDLVIRYKGLYDIPAGGDIMKIQDKPVTIKELSDDNNHVFIPAFYHWQKDIDNVDAIKYFLNFEVEVKYKDGTSCISHAGNSRVNDKSLRGMNNPLPSKKDDLKGCKKSPSWAQCPYVKVYYCNRVRVDTHQPMDSRYFDHDTGDSRAGAVFLVSFDEAYKKKDESHVFGATQEDQVIIGITAKY
jgi:hypothetical protein